MICVNITLRIFLLLVAVFTLLFVVRKLRKSALEIIDSIFWVFLAVLLIVVAAFPQLVFWVTGIFGFDSSSNFVFFCGILVLLARTFTQNLKIAELKKKLTKMAQTVALDNTQKTAD